MVFFPPPLFSFVIVVVVIVLYTLTVLQIVGDAHMVVVLKITVKEWGFHSVVMWSR